MGLTEAQKRQVCRAVFLDLALGPCTLNRHAYPLDFSSMMRLTSGNASGDICLAAPMQPKVGAIWRCAPSKDSLSPSTIFKPSLKEEDVRISLQLNNAIHKRTMLPSTADAKGLRAVIKYTESALVWRGRRHRCGSTYQRSICIALPWN